MNSVAAKCTHFYLGLVSLNNKQTRKRKQKIKTKIVLAEKHFEKAKIFFVQLNN